MNLPFKVCPECGVEHVHTAIVCADCNVALEIARTETAEPPTTAPLPPASELTRVAAGGPWEMERLALQLQEAGISSRIDAMPSGQVIPRHVANAAARGSSASGARLALYVLPAEGEPARRVIQGILLEDSPDGATPAREGEPLEACPACGAPISEVASACTDCGLEFLPVENLCSFCGAVLTVGATACPSCGGAPPREGAT
jgi:hypothetical protein